MKHILTLFLLFIAPLLSAVSDSAARNAFQSENYGEAALLWEELAKEEHSFPLLESLSPQAIYYYNSAVSYKLAGENLKSLENFLKAERGYLFDQAVKNNITFLKQELNIDTPSLFKIPLAGRIITTLLLCSALLFWLFLIVQNRGKRLPKPVFSLFTGLFVSLTLFVAVLRIGNGLTSSAMIIEETPLYKGDGTIFPVLNPPLALLPGTEVRQLEKKRGWVEVRFISSEGASQEGWVPLEKLALLGHL